MNARRKNRYGAVCVVGEVKVEYRMSAESAPVPGVPGRASAFFESVSGVGGIQALACARLGARVSLFCKMGDDPQSDALKAALAREGIQLAPVPLDSDERTGVELVIDSPGEGTETISTGFAGANERFGEADVFQGAPDLAHAGAVLVTLGIPAKSVSAAIRLGAGSQRPVVVDSGGWEPGRSGFPQAIDGEQLALVDVLCLRSEHAAAWTGEAALDRESARVAAEHLIWKGARAVIVDAGEEEKLLLQDERELHLPRYSSEPGVSGSPGATQSLSAEVFPAALAVALAEERSIFEAATFANAAAALAGRERDGVAGLPRRHEVVELLRRDGIDYDGVAAA